MPEEPAEDILTKIVAKSLARTLKQSDNRMERSKALQQSKDSERSAPFMPSFRARSSTSSPVFKSLASPTTRGSKSQVTGILSVSGQSSRDGSGIDLGSTPSTPSRKSKATKKPGNLSLLSHKTSQTISEMNHFSSSKRRRALFTIYQFNGLLSDATRPKNTQRSPVPHPKLF